MGLEGRQDSKHTGEIGLLKSNWTPQTSVRSAEIVNPTNVIVLNNSVLTVQVFFQSFVVLKPGDEFAPYQEELASLPFQHLQLLDRSAAIGRILDSVAFHQDADYTF